MVGFSKAAVALFIVAALLSGCAGKGADDGTVVKLGDGSTVELHEDPAPESGKGSISGVVVDDAIRPLAGVLVAVSGKDAAVATDETGLFVVADLEPGLYTLQANATGYLPIQTTAEVVAGDTAKVRIVLATDPTPQPVHVTLQFDGFIQAGNGLANQAWQLFVNGTAGVPVDSCECQFYFSTESEASTFVIEVVWEPTVANPAGTSSGYYALWDDGEPDGGYVDNGCDNPCYGVVGWSEFALAETRNFHTDIWIDSDWVQVNQKFTQYVTIFYNGEAPDGWSFVNGDR